MLNQRWPGMSTMMLRPRSKVPRVATCARRSAGLAPDWDAPTVATPRVVSSLRGLLIPYVYSTFAGCTVRTLVKFFHLSLMSARGLKSRMFFSVRPPPGCGSP